MKFNSFIPFLSVLRCRLSAALSISVMAVGLSLTAHSAMAQIYVKQGGTGSGTTWDNATGIIPTGKLPANTKIYIAAGNYSITAETDLEENGILIQGGFPSTATGTSLAGYNPLGNTTTLTRAGAGRFYNEGSTTTADNDNQIEVKGITFTGATGNGGLFFLSTGRGNYTFTDVTAHDMTVTNGVIYLTTFNFGSVNIINCNFYGNTATADGGVIYHSTENNNAKLVISKSVFSNNHANHGGALYITSINDSFDAVSIEKSSFCANSAGLYGGAIYQTSSRIKINESTFNNNTCPDGYYGGAIFATTAQLTITGSNFYNNKGGAGGAIYSTTAFAGNTNTLSGSTFFGNEATNPSWNATGTNGGGAMCMNANANAWTISSSKFISNKVPAAGWGGAIATYDLETSLDNCIFYDNQKGENAGISGSDIKNYDNAGGFFSITNSKMQLSSAAAYLNQTSATDASSYAFTGGANLFSNTDNAGVTDPGFSCPNTIAFNYSIEGNIYDDANGLKDGIINGVTTNLPSYLKVTLMSGGTPISTVVATDGIYSFADVPQGTYTLVLNLTSTLRALDSDWVTTGEFVGTGTGNDGQADGNLEVTVLNMDIINANFGINQIPLAKDISVTIPTPPVNSSITLDGANGNPTAPNGSDHEDLLLGSGSDIVFTTLPTNGELHYNGGLVIANTAIPAFDPTLLTLKLTGSGYTSSTFNYSFIDKAGIQGKEGIYTVNLTNPLPVTLVRFEAVKENSTVLLSWATTSEINSDRFEVQKSRAGKSWEIIGTVSATGIGVHTSTYHFIDASPSQGQNLYRLRIVDKDESFAISRIQNVEFSETATKIYPNPSSEKVFISAGVMKSIAEVMMVDGSGRAVFKGNATDQGIDVTGLPTGIYILKVKYLNGTLSTHKIMINR